jgi:hypothetical protein
VIEESAATALQPWFPGMDLRRVRLVHTGPVAWFVRSVLRQGAMTIAPFIFFGKHQYDPESPRSLALLAHELVHIRQYGEMGRARFLFRYVRDRIRAGSYSRELPLELEPYAVQDAVLGTLEAPDV